MLIFHYYIITITQGVHQPSLCFDVPYENPSEYEQLLLDCAHGKSLDLTAAKTLADRTAIGYIQFCIGKETLYTLREDHSIPVSPTAICSSSYPGWWSKYMHPKGEETEIGRAHV